ncbi:MAG: radical SAM protein [Ruminococcaceae bacterium]|nr:radical SAM protein [Oscillospiraceae bacterium]
MKNGGCVLCPRMCGADRSGGGRGFCGASSQLLLARAALHMWEEPCISGTRGSGTVFFSGCQLGCVFCQNYRISADGFGAAVTEERLAQIFLSLQEQGVHNINLVSATPYTEAILRVLDRIRGKELTIPVVWNSGGYERVETLRRLDGYVDIYLPDYKYHDPARAEKYSGAADYPAVALAAIREMMRQTGKYLIGDDGILVRGTVIRHLVLPGGRHDSLACVDDIAQNFGTDDVLLSLMSQYTPFYRAAEFPEINRRVTTFEYESVCRRVREYGFEGFFQEKSSAKEEYTPPFDLEGV